MMVSQWVPASAMLIALAASLPAQTEKGFLDRTVRSGALTLKYQVYVPPSYDGHTSLPVILFMHGSGERGSDGIKQTQVGLPSQIRWHRDWFNAIVVMPQCPDDSVFRGMVADATFEALEKSVKEFH
ncbi:MAG: phospholipase, partial [Gemmatimonadota bacterium]|nr:phospholipase [Gemmatimonadota bacterium]